MITYYFSSFIKTNHKGSIIIITLFIVSITSLISTAAITISHTNIGITGNMKILQEAFYTAEVALAVGEMAVMNLDSREEFSEHTIAGHYGPTHKHDWEKMAWDATDSIEVAQSKFPTGFTHMAQLPRYTIQVSVTDRDSLVDGIYGRPGVYQFSIHSLGTGSSAKTRTVLQSVVIRRFE